MADRLPSRRRASTTSVANVAYSPTPNGPPIKVLVFSWNVGNAQPDEDELEHWCPEGGGDFDLVVVGTQENTYKKKRKTGVAAAAPAPDADAAAAGGEAEEVDEDALRDWNSDDEESDREVTEEELAAEQAREQFTKKTQAQRNHWDSIVQQRLGMEWGVVKSGVLWQMRLSVFAPLRHIAGDSAVITGTDLRKSRTGIGGVVANKGGLVCKLNFAGTTLCFVSAHLAAHSHKLKQRNDNCQEILRETARVAENHLDAASQFDHVFWLGDLNYRVDLNWRCEEDGRPEKPDDAHWAEISALVDKQDWAGLAEWDQLNLSQQAGEAFVNFVEGPLKFKPTFKVLRHRGTEYKGNRIPSYCDRVLWKSMPQRAGAVKQTRMTGLEAVSTSDHKPIVAHFEIARSPVVPRLIARHLNHAPLIRFTSLKAEGVRAADLNGKSDPYVVFYSNPLGLFGKTQPKSHVVKETRNPTWTERGIPLLRPLVTDANALDSCALVLALYDSDVAGANDPLGRVIVPLGPPEGTVADAPTGYTVRFKKDVVLGNKSAGMGTLEGEFTVTYGSALHGALVSAKHDRAGSKARRKQHTPKSCAIM